MYSTLHVFAGDESGTLRFWELSTGWLMRSIPLGGHIRSLAFNPTFQLSPLLLVASCVACIVLHCHKHKCLFARTIIYL